MAHILIAYKGASGAPTKTIRSKEQARKLALDLVRRSTKEEFAKLAKQYSDDPTTSTKGGDWGEITTPAKPAALVDAARSLAAGSVSPPVEAPDGFHVLKRVGK